MADVFLSYKRDERGAVEQISSRLMALGLTVWFDAGINAGETFNSEIDREARSAKVVLVCWSPGARQSQWVMAEAMIGFTEKKLAACYVAGPVTFDPPAPFNIHHAEDLRSWLTSPNEAHPAWKSVLRRLGKLCNRRDIEDWGKLSQRPSVAELRGWIAAYPESPLGEAANSLLILASQDAEIQRVGEHSRWALQKDKDSHEIDDERLEARLLGPALPWLAVLLVVFVGFIVWSATQTSTPPQSQAIQRSEPSVAPPLSSPVNELHPSQLGCEDLVNASHAALAQRFGANNVRTDQVGVGEGNRYPATVVFADDPTRRVEFIRTPTTGELWQVRIVGHSNLWRGPAGLTLGQSIADVEAINGTAFLVTGWGWDYGGRGHDWRGGALAGAGCRVFLDFSARRSAPLGDQDYSSDSVAVRDADAVLQRIILAPS